MISLIISLVIYAISVFKQRLRFSLYIFYLVLALVIAAVSSILVETVPEDPLNTIARHIQYLGTPFIAPLMLLFFMDFCSFHINQKLHIPSLLFFPIGTLLVAILYPEFLLPQLDEPGSNFRYIYFAYNYIFLMAIILALSRRSERDAVFKKQARVIVFAVVLPMLGFLLTAFGDVLGTDANGNLGANNAVLYVAVGGYIISCTLLFGGLFQIAPIAREEIVENIRDGFILADVHGNFLDANSAAKNLYPQLLSLQVGQPLSKVAGIPWDEDGWQEQELKVGARYYRTSKDVVMHNNAPFCHCIMVYDITPVQERLNETLRMAEYDALTGLMNRRTLLQNAKVKCTEMMGGDWQAYVFMIDVDYFKEINDSWGHQKGDEVLKAVAANLSSRLRKTDLFARYGGDEFCAFLFASDTDDAMKVAEGFKKSTADMPLSPTENKRHVTLSIGIAHYEPGGYLQLEDVIAQADAALYAAKKNGRNRYEFFREYMLVKD